MKAENDHNMKIEYNTNPPKIANNISLPKLYEV